MPLLNKIHFDKANRTLSCGSKHISLEPKVYEVLSLLVEAKGNLVSRDEIIQHIWQGRVVSDGAINRTISLLRNYFLQLDPNTSYIETVPKAGYKFIAEIIQQETPKSESNNTINTSPSSSKPAYPKRQLNTIVSILFFLLLCTLYYFAEHTSKSDRQSYQNIPVSSYTGVEYNISTNSSGKSVLFHKTTDNKARLWLIDADNIKGQPITPPNINAYGGQLSPDGHKIIYAAFTNNQCQIKMLSLPQLASINITDCGIESYARFSWNHEGDGFFYRARKDQTQPYAIHTYHLDTQWHAQVSSPYSGGNRFGYYLLAQHPTENRLAIAYDASRQETQLRIIDSQSYELLSTHTIPHYLSNLQWHPNENKLLFAAGEKLMYYEPGTRQTNTQIFVGKPIQSFSLVSPQRNNTILYYSTYQKNSHIWSKSINGKSKATRWQQSSKSDFMPRLANHSAQAIFLSNRLGQTQIWSANSHEKSSNSEQPLNIHLPFNLTETRFEWSPDDDYLAFSEAGAAYSINNNTLELKQLLPEDSQAYVVNFADNSKQLIYSSNKTGQWQLWLKDLSSGSDTQLTKQGGYSGRLYKDRLLYSKFNQNGLWSKPLNDHKETLLISDFHKINWWNWHIRDNYLYYYKPNIGVWQYELDSGKEQLILPWDKYFVHQYHVSADKQFIYYVKNEPMRGDVYKMFIADK